MDKLVKPLGGKAYGSIAHLPSSRLGPGDHCCHEGQAKICLEKVRDKHDKVIIQEKVDGSNVAVALINGEICPLTRSGYLANTSKYEQHHLFWNWAWTNRKRFLELLRDGERVCGEWVAQAHGTRYNCSILFEPFLAFDIIRDHTIKMIRLPFNDFTERVCSITNPFNTPKFLSYGPLSIEKAMELVNKSSPFRIDDAEGVVYRVERYNKVDFLTKYVRPNKIDGLYLPEVSGKDPVWNWRPNQNG